jgi:hypothetical protein
MKHNVPAPDLVKRYLNATKDERREMIFLAFEAEFDADRPFSLDWKDNDDYFQFDGISYLYKPQYGDKLESASSDFSQKFKVTEQIETVHFLQFKTE